MTSSTILTVTCLAITVCVTIFMILSISLPQWYTMKVSEPRLVIKGEIGLFKQCQEIGVTRQCVTFKGELLLGVYL